MAKRSKKIQRLSGIKERTVYRDSMRRFCSKENAVSEETWKYREGIVKGKRKIVDLKIDALPYSEGETSWFPSIAIPETGARAGKLNAKLASILKQSYVKRTDTRYNITMTAKTYHGKIVRRKLSIYHYNAKKLNEHTVGGIINQLFYEYGDRPAYPVKIVKGWRKRHVTRKETEGRRQLYDVTFHIEATVESRKAAKARKKKK